jgi:hypothetical protein
MGTGDVLDDPTNAPREKCNYIKILGAQLNHIMAAQAVAFFPEKRITRLSKHKGNDLHMLECSIQHIARRSLTERTICI